MFLLNSRRQHTFIIFCTTACVTIIFLQTEWILVNEFAILCWIWGLWKVLHCNDRKSIRKLMRHFMILMISQKNTKEGKYRNTRKAWFPLFIFRWTLDYTIHNAAETPIFCNLHFLIFRSGIIKLHKEILNYSNWRYFFYLW